MAIDLEQIRKNYADFDNDKIEYLAKNEINSLEPEVVSILMDEIKKRRLDTNLNKGIEAQKKELTDADVQELKLKISNLTCPECGQKKNRLVGTLIREVKSFVILTHYEKRIMISCESCGQIARKNGLTTTLLRGWWGLPEGLFRTFFVVLKILGENKKLEVISDAIMTEFVIKNIGEIKTNWDKENELVDYIRHKNKMN
jgi:Zn finger protein HypA/HybF involved in hydrogenase expression